MVSRRQLLRGKVSSNTTESFPPWAIEASLFAERCTRCHACLQNCPQQIIKHNQKGLPVVDFDSGGCTFCAACAESCETGSLSLLAFIGEEPWSLKAKVSERCVNYHAGVYRICADVCVAGAITF